MIERLDGGCRAKVLCVRGDRVLLDAYWPATESDRRRGFFVGPNGIARNTVEVSKSYFERKYGEKL